MRVWWVPIELNYIVKCVREELREQGAECATPHSSRALLPALACSLPSHVGFSTHLLCVTEAKKVVWRSEQPGDGGGLGLEVPESGERRA